MRVTVGNTIETLLIILTILFVVSPLILLVWFTWQYEQDYLNSCHEQQGLVTGRGNLMHCIAEDGTIIPINGR